MSTPKVGVAYTFSIALLDANNPGRLKTTPTIAAGDFKLINASSQLVNLTNLPVESPAGSGNVQVSLTAAEVIAKNTIMWSDPQFEWGDGHYFFDATTVTVEDLPAVGAAMTLTAGERSAIAAAILDLTDAIEAGLTLRGMCRFLGAVLGGVRTQTGTGTELFRNAVANSKVRVTATIDSSSNRTLITTDLT